MQFNHTFQGALSKMAMLPAPSTATSAPFMTASTTSALRAICPTTRSSCTSICHGTAQRRDFFALPSGNTRSQLAGSARLCRAMAQLETQSQFQSTEATTRADFEGFPTFKWMPLETPSCFSYAATTKGELALVQAERKPTLRPLEPDPDNAGGGNDASPQYLQETFGKPVSGLTSAPLPVAGLPPRNF